MGRTWKTKNDRIRRKTSWKAWEGISQKDEECIRDYWATWRLQVELHQEIEGRTTWGWAHQKASWRRIGERKAQRSWKIEESCTNKRRFQKSQWRSSQDSSINCSQRKGRRKKNSWNWKEKGCIGSSQENQGRGKIQIKASH